MSKIHKKSICNNLRILTNTYWENTPSNKNQALTKSINMDIWAVGILYQQFIGGSWTQTKFSKNKVVSGKNPVLCDIDTLYSLYLS